MKNKLGTLYDIKNIIIHEDFNSKTLDYDFALIELKEEIKFSSTVQRIKLPDPDYQLKDGTMCLVTGWGETESKKSRNVLRGAKVPIFNQEKCVNIYRNSYYGPPTSNMLCAGFEKNEKGTCRGYCYDHTYIYCNQTSLREHDRQRRQGNRAEKFRIRDV